MAYFADAVCKYGIPDQVRLWWGKCSRWAIHAQSESAVLIGSFTHIDRIEHLCHDVYRCVGVLFADLFCEMVRDGALSCLNEVISIFQYRSVSLLRWCS